MELWTEYEGRTIDGAFPLKRLLLPEGRSAFFSTLNGAGNPTVIRLIESHFDEEEILARWRGVEALKHPNLLKLEQFGQLKLDDTTVIYAVMEPVEANLGEVVGQQRITVAEARDLASSLASALDVLHTHGFVHEHVEPSNIFAVGDLVKLRSDCIREAPEGQHGLEAKRRDVYDLALVLLQSLTQQRSLEAAARELPLPSPLEQIVRKAMSGEWGLTEIKAALPTAKRAAAPAAVDEGPAVVARPKHVVTERAAVVAAVPDAGSARKTMISIKPVEAPVAVPVGQTVPAAKQIALPLVAAEPQADDAEPPVFAGHRLSFGDEPEEANRFARPGLIAAGILAAMLALGIGWHFASQSAAHPGKSGQAQPSQAQPGQSAAVAAPALRPAIATSAAVSAAAGESSVGKSAAKKPGAQSALASAAQKNGASSSHVQWRVVAFTFNHQDQARKKSDSIAKAHPELRPEVFTITGHAPFLVSVGGAMSRDEAYAFARLARGAGMPRDCYAQNYTARGR